MIWWVSGVAVAQQAAPSGTFTGDPAIDAWVRTTFGQSVDPETLDNPVWGTRTLLALTADQREGSRGREHWTFCVD